ncbi:MAG: UPF0149 family protein [Gammaproteobacteria bacterium]
MPDKCLEECLRVTADRGVIVGARSAGEDASAAARLTGTGAGGDAAEQELAFATVCLDGLRAGGFDLPAMLLDETLPLAVRVELLTVFVRGFLSGLGQAGERLAAVGADGVEMLSDLETLSRGAVLEGGATTDVEERAYRELVEYLRFPVAYFYRALV